MRIKILGLALVVVIAVLVGCSDVSAPEFPTYFVRTTDGAMLYLGMHKNDVEMLLNEHSYLSERVGTEDMMERLSEINNEIMLRWGESAGENILVYQEPNGFIGILYNDNNLAMSIFVMMADGWVIDNVISVGKNIRVVIDNDQFPYIFQGAIEPGITVLDDPENHTYGIMFTFDDERNITTIHLAYLPHFME